MTLQTQQIAKPKEVHLIRGSGLNIPTIFGARLLNFGSRIDRENPDEIEKEFTGNIFTDDFNGTALNKLFWDETTGGNATISVASGFVTLARGDDAGAYAQLDHVNTGKQSVKGDIIIEAKIRKQSGGQTDVYFGLANGAGLNRRVVFFANNGEGEVFKPQTKDSVGTTTGTNFTFSDDTWYVVKIILKSASAEFYLSNTLQETISTNIPNTEELGAMGQIARVAGGTSKNLDIDWVSINFGEEI